MGKARDWAEEIQGTDIEYIGRKDNYIVCGKDGFIFNVYRTTWPPNRLTPEVAEDPTGYYKFQVTQIHGDKYNLDKILYKKADKNVIVGCKVHGDFEIRAANFKRGKGCPLCSYIAIGDKNRGTKDAFIEKSVDVHGNLYDYSLVEYVNANKAVKIVCSLHGVFEQIPYNHLTGRGCMSCGLERSKLSKVLSIEEVLGRFESVHGARYSYTDVVYIGDAHSLLGIICKEHGNFQQSYANHYHNKQGCPECAKEFSARLRSGFVKSSNSKDGYASLYLINCFDENENFHKIGITTKPLKHRFGGKEAMPYYYTLENLLVGDAAWLWELEKLLHKEYKLHKYIPEKEFGGRYECFAQIDLDEYIKLLNTVA